MYFSFGNQRSVPDSLIYYTYIKLISQVSLLVYYNVRLILVNFSWVIRMLDYRVIGERLRKQRKKAALTQENVAERANITVVYMSKIENGRVRPTLDLLCQICEIVGLDLGDLFHDASTRSAVYQNEEVLRLFNACSPAVKPIALELLMKLAELQ